MRTLTNSTTAEQGRLPPSFSDPSLSKRHLATERKQSSPNFLDKMADCDFGTAARESQVVSQHLSLNQMKSVDENLEPEDNDSFFGFSNSDVSHQFIKKKIPEFHLTNHGSENHESHSIKQHLKSLFNLQDEQHGVKWNCSFNSHSDKSHNAIKELDLKYQELMAHARNIFDVIHPKSTSKQKKSFCLLLFKSHCSATNIARERELHYLNFLKFMDESYNSHHREACISLFNSLRQCAVSFIKLFLRGQESLEPSQAVQNRQVKAIKQFRRPASPANRKINPLLVSTQMNALSLIALCEFAQSNRDLIWTLSNILSKSSLSLWQTHHQVFQLSYECFLRKRQKKVKAPEHIMGHLTSFSANCLVLAVAQLSICDKSVDVISLFQMSVEYFHVNSEKLAKLFLDSNRYSLIQNLAILILKYSAVAPSF